MLGILKQKAEKFRAISTDSLLQEIFSSGDLDSQIIDLNQKQLYEQGIQADSTPTGDYSPNTRRRKQAYGDSFNTPGESGHITGNDTGITYKSMNVVAQPDGIVINADDRNNFFEREPKGLGLTKESLSEILPEVRERFKEKLLTAAL
jgi:hypothetical protein